MAKTPGSLWIEGEQLGYVDASGREWNVQGDYVGPSNPSGFPPNLGKPGSVWIEPDGSMHYCGASGADYRCPLLLMHADAASQKASLWVDGNYLFYSVGTGKYWVHGDTTHNDGGQHTDVPHGDHTDAAHTDAVHGDAHTDQPHFDSAHGDSITNHSDGHNDYVSTGPSGGGPGSHADGGTYWTDETGSHTDTHYDSYGTYQVTPVHTDYHWDSGQHSDGSHGDSIHADSHTDSAHSDAHGDAHSDSPHQDTEHTDGAGSHYDEPRFIGP